MFSDEIRRFEGLPHRQWKSFFLAFTDDEEVPRNVWSHHWTLTTVPVLSLIKTVSSCVVQIVCVITNQGYSNPNCFKIIRFNTSMFWREFLTSYLCFTFAVFFSSFLILIFYHFLSFLKKSYSSNWIPVFGFQMVPWLIIQQAGWRAYTGEWWTRFDLGTPGRKWWISSCVRVSR